MTQDYYGTKRITAWEQDKDDAPGYAVKYADGYTSWSPKDVFEAAYQPLTALSFGHALLALEEGRRVARAGWNGKGMWLALSCKGTLRVAASQFWSKHNRAYAESRDGTAFLLPSITMKTETGEILMGWLASQTDMLAKDWQIVE